MGCSYMGLFKTCLRVEILDSYWFIRIGSAWVNMCLWIWKAILVQRVTQACIQHKRKLNEILIWSRCFCENVSLSIQRNQVLNINMNEKWKNIYLMHQLRLILV